MWYILLVLKSYDIYSSRLLALANYYIIYTTLKVTLFFRFVRQHNMAKSVSAIFNLVDILFFPQKLVLAIKVYMSTLLSIAAERKPRKMHLVFLSVS